MKFTSVMAVASLLFAGLGLAAPAAAPAPAIIDDIAVRAENGKRGGGHVIHVAPGDGSDDAGSFIQTNEHDAAVVKDVETREGGGYLDGSEGWRRHTFTLFWTDNEATV
ncbi:uncharacterized protein AB675_15 [Cyphellophora attinorum]|uniref:Uncharacterized protein n=1 Tax=Cyphellophora attinorum TaxID=1664694 RepID=A0A0N1H1L6_9EURO|nr:uncharacterized protein AB675_15 [Phialophora attinorum]KPI34737.1 hypothetical protein AB675_15 [Phialophora attinorum]